MDEENLHIWEREKRKLTNFWCKNKENLPNLEKLWKLRIYGAQKKGALMLDSKKKSFNKWDAKKGKRFKECRKKAFYSGKKEAIGSLLMEKEESVKFIW